MGNRPPQAIALAAGDNIFAQADGLGADADRVTAFRTGRIKLQDVLAVVHPKGVFPLDLNEVRRPNEIRHERRARRKINIVRLTLLVEVPVLHDDDGVRHGERLLLVVRDINRRQPHLLLNIAKLNAHRFTELGVEIGERLVEKQDVRLHDQRPGNGDPLLLTAGHLIGVAILQSRELHERQSLADLLADDLRGTAPHPETIGHVLVNVHVRKERVFLKYHRRIPSIGRDTLDLTPCQMDLAAVRLVKPGDHAQDRRLTAARRP